MGGGARTARGQRTRATLVAAARTIFERDGYHDARLGDITELAGISTGSFYTYFDSKEEALAAVFESAAADMLPGRGVVADELTDDPGARIEAANRAYFEAYRRNARLMLLMEQVTALEPRFREQRRNRARVFTERNAARTAELQEQGLADPALDPVLAARALSGMVARLAYHSYALGGEEEVEALTRHTTRLWLNALGMTRP